MLASYIATCSCLIMQLVQFALAVLQVSYNEFLLNTHPFIIKVLVALSCKDGQYIEDCNWRLFYIYDAHAAICNQIIMV